MKNYVNCPHCEAEWLGSSLETEQNCPECGKELVEYRHSHQSGIGQLYHHSHVGGNVYHSHGLDLFYGGVVK
jgi:predicted RNA-binding Zn-ribbon protein involved in translation (DUF1610 family)